MDPHQITVTAASGFAGASPLLLRFHIAKRQCPSHFGSSRRATKTLGARSKLVIQESKVEMTRSSISRDDFKNIAGRFLPLKANITERNDRHSIFTKRAVDSPKTICPGRDNASSRARYLRYRPRPYTPSAMQSRQYHHDVTWIIRVDIHAV